MMAAAPFLLFSQALVIERPCCHVADHVSAVFGSNVTNDVDYVRREVIAVEPFEACEGPIEQDLSGKMALILRGKCNFAWKVLQAQRANAIAVVVMDHTPRSSSEPWELQMIGDGNATEIHIPSVFVSHETGQAILGNITTGGPVLLTLNTTGNRKDLLARYKCSSLIRNTCTT
ncbi:unnamed protein product [Aphanomyces euteiches]